MGRQRRFNRALKQFRAKKVISLDELVRLLSRSTRTAQRQLKEWGTYTSYNQNGRYYVLPDIPTFDEYGLWRFKNAFFSMHGNLMDRLRVLSIDLTQGLLHLKSARSWAFLPIRSYLILGALHQ